MTRNQYVSNKTYLSFRIKWRVILTTEFIVQMPNESYTIIYVSEIFKKPIKNHKQYNIKKRNKN